MPDLPPPAEATKARTAVAKALHRQLCPAREPDESLCFGAVHYLPAADAALAAAAPYLRAQAYAEIRQLATDTGAIVTCHTPETDDGVNIRLTHVHPFADLIGDPPC